MTSMPTEQPQRTTAGATSSASSGPRPLGPELSWLAPCPTFSQDVRALDRETDGGAAWTKLVALAGTRLDFIQTGRLDKSLRKAFGDTPPDKLTTKPLRLAVLGSSTLAHLLPGLRVGGLRRGLWVTTYEPDYGQFLQELLDPSSSLHGFKPNAVLIAFDAAYVTRGLDGAADKAQADAVLDKAVAELRQVWRLARDAFNCPLIQQTVASVSPPILGSNEHRLPGSRHRMISRLNVRLREIAEEDGVDLLALDDQIAQDGVKAWHDPVFWHKAKQEIGPAAGPYYGEMVARLLGAKQGLSAKCLVLDLDNTLWGGVIGDDGLDRIVLGQGSASGEAFLALQTYARDQAKRGVILAVCSKNDEANALAPFEQHPEMILKRSDISAFVANWDDKAKNIRTIAQQLNIGLDSLVFVDDNPFERNLVRSELPMVAVPEIPEDPALVPGVLAAASYFEGLAVTDEDRERTRQYQANQERTSFQADAANLDDYLRGLAMKLIWRRFDRLGLQRIVQLINKTNQFNLMTRRYTEEDVLAVMQDDRCFGLQLRLLDRFGDNGIIAIIIGRGDAATGDVEIDTWLMSCRVLGRQVEETTRNLVVSEARRIGGRRLIGCFRPTPKNGMVKDHYRKLGFGLIDSAPDGSTRWALDLPTFHAEPTFIETIEG